MRTYEVASDSGTVEFGKLGLGEETVHGMTVVDAKKERAKVSFSPFTSPSSTMERRKRTHPNSWKKVTKSLCNIVAGFPAVAFARFATMHTVGVSRPPEALVQPGMRPQTAA